MKLFCVSDIHSYLDELLTTLGKKKFDINNPEHVLLIDGDVFDRGPKTLELYSFLMSIPKERRILVKGNHEQLYMELLDKSFPEEHDFTNGTVRTFCAIAGVDEETLTGRYWRKQRKKSPEDFDSFRSLHFEVSRQ